MLKWILVIFLTSVSNSFAQFFLKSQPIPALLYDKNHPKLSIPIKIYPFHYRKRVTHQNSTISGIVVHLKDFSADMQSCKKSHRPLMIQFEQKNKFPEYCVINTRNQKCYLGHVHFDEIKKIPFQVKYYCGH